MAISASVPRPCSQMLDTYDFTRYPTAMYSTLLLQVDLWTETLEASEYDALAMLIANGVTTEVDSPTEARPDVEDGRGSVGESVASATDARANSLAR